MNKTVCRYLYLFVLLTAMPYTSSLAQEVADSISSDGYMDSEADNSDGMRISDDPPSFDEEPLPERVYEPDRTSADPAPVGGTPASFSVSPTGAAAYSIKIDIPKGINGMEPELSLVYNSQGGNNIAGWGFSMSHVSAISFVPKDIYHDGQARPLHYDWDDGLSLDGRRLILKSGTPGAAGAVYTPEGDPYTNVSLMTDNSTGKLFFRIETPDGMRYNYGKGSSLYTVTIGNEEHYVAWYLSARFDRHSTDVSYTYLHDENCIYPSGVYYDDKMVAISYENRGNDPRTYYIGSTPVTMRKRIRTITVKKKVSGEIYRRYTLSYDTTSDQSGTRYSRLVSVTESNASGESLKPVTIAWNSLPGFGLSPADSSRDAIPYFKVADYGRVYSATDLNGDGISDLIYIYQGKDTSQGNNQDYTFVFVFLSYLDSQGHVAYSYRRTFRTEPGFSINNVKGYVSGISHADMDGDGLGDICLSNVEQLGNGGNFTLYTVITGNTVQNNSSLIVGPQLSVPNYYTGRAPVYTISDFDRDGRSELFHLETGQTNGVYKGAYLYNVNTSDSILSGTEFSVTLPSTPKYIFSGDFDNDGMTDVVLFCESGYKVFLNQGGAHNACPFSDSHSLAGTDISYRTRMIPGDFNGDGLLDFFMNGHESHDYYLVTCNGDGTFTQSTSIQLGLYEQDTDRDDNRFCLIPLDFDHNEKTDLLLGKAIYKYHGFPQYYHEYKHTEFRWYRSTGTGFELLRKSKTYRDDDSRPEYVFTGDFTGNGQTEIMNYGNDIYGTPMDRASSSANPPILEDDDFLLSLMEQDRDEENESTESASAGFEEADSVGERRLSSLSTDMFYRYTHDNMSAGTGRAAGMTDSFGNVSTPVYASLTNGGVYTASTDAAYPVNDITAALSVVRSYTETNGTSGNSSRSLSYGGLKAHVAGKGLLGFSRTSLLDNVSGSMTETTLSAMDSIYYEPGHRTTLTTAGSMTSATDENFLISTRYNNHWTYPASAVSTDIYGNEAETQYSHNLTNGTLTSEQTIYDGESGMSRGKSIQYVLKGGSYRPSQTTATSSHPDSQGETHQTTETAAYNNYGDVTAVTELAGTDLSRTTSFTYDTKGNPLTKVEQTGADSYLTTTYTYFDNRDLATITTSPSSSTRSYTYDLWSRPLTHTETYGDTILTTVNTYDGWGNLTGTVSPDGVTTTYTRGWGTTPGKKYYILEERQGAPWVKTWYDSRGRKVLVESVGPDHLLSNQETSYDSQGRVVLRRVQLGNRVSADTITYDVLGRVTSERHTAGCNTTYTYGNRTVTSLTNGITQTKTLDAWGNVSSVTENGTSVNFSYAPNGKPKEVTSNEHHTYIGYDEAGNRTSLTDPDAGTSTWEYDNNGRVTRHTDARGKVTQTTYDVFGNKQQENIDGTVTRYYYDTPGKHVVWESSNGHIRRFDFDEHGRLKRSGTYIRNGEGTIFKQYTYDSFGRVMKHNYTFGVNATYGFDEYGYRTWVKVNGTKAWRLLEYTGRREKCLTLNDSVLTLRRYDHAGRLIRQKRSEPEASLQYIQNTDSLAYSYDAATSNLIEERHFAGLAQAPRKLYSYDSLDRLVSAETRNSHGNTTDTQTLTYGADGNILSKTGIGSYTYGSSKPHAVTGVENTSSIIPQTPQSITYNAYGKVTHITDGGYTLDIDYGTDRQRWRSTLTDSLDNVVRSIRYFEDMDIVTRGDTSLLVLYLDGGVIFVRERDNTQAPSRMYHLTTDRLGSITDIVDGNGEKLVSNSYDAWGKPVNWQSSNWFLRGYTGHEMIPEMRLINMNGRIYDPVLGRFLSPDDYVQMPLSPQGYNRYTYCGNNPLKYTDPSGEIFTWFFGKSGFSLGLNFCQLGIPLGFGLNVGWDDGISFGGYGEVGYRVGGSGFGSGITLSQSIDYNVIHESWTTTTTEHIYGSLGLFNAGASFSQSYNFQDKNWSNSWNFGLGVGIGNEQWGIGVNVGYGSDGFTYGVGGYFDSHAWDDNPAYEPERWNVFDIIKHNNCYTYALDEMGWWVEHPNLDPGGDNIEDKNINLDVIKERAFRDKRMKEPSFFNKIGFGRRGYYPVYLVIDPQKDAHWYRQDKGGFWSHKRGSDPVINYDASNHLIKNPAKANHNYGDYNYNKKGALLWVRRH